MIAPESPGSGGGSARLRPLAEPAPADVRTDAHGLPVAVRAGRRVRRVEAVREVWRIDDEWWRRPMAREYVAVVLEDGRSLTLYRDLVEGGWWVQG